MTSLLLVVSLTWVVKGIDGHPKSIYSFTKDHRKEEKIDSITKNKQTKKDGFETMEFWKTFAHAHRHIASPKQMLCLSKLIGLTQTTGKQQQKTVRTQFVGISRTISSPLE